MNMKLKQKKGNDMNIIITAGGTSEYIDSVRKITNSGSGMLGSMIADEFENDNIFYIHTPKAKLPSKVNFVDIEVEGVRNLEEKVKEILTKEKIDIFIHSMAVSDYFVESVTNTEKLISDFEKGLTINNFENKFDTNTKITSDSKDLVIVLKKAPKIIEIIKEISPSTTLVGFKLLTNVDEKTLENTARNLLIKNRCDYVVANDLEKINKDKHEAILIDKEKILARFNTKIEIAKGIKKAVYKN